MNSYALLFGFESSENGQNSIKFVLHSLRYSANVNLGTNNRPAGVEGTIEIGCAATYAGVNICEGGRAVVLSADDGYEEFMNFCPAFWSVPRFDQLKNAPAADVYNLYKNPRYSGTDGMSKSLKRGLVKTNAHFGFSHLIIS